MNSLPVKLILLLGASWLFSAICPPVEAKRSRSSAQTRCRQEECQLRSQHFALYANIKRALDTDFDISGKDIIPLLRSVELLRLRFGAEQVQESTERALNGTKLVRSLLANETLTAAVKVFLSDEGKALTDLYRSSVNGKGQNLACSQLRVQDIERASVRLESSEQLAQIFAKIHRNYLKKSAKKCLKRSCSSIDTSMSRLDSVLGKHMVADDEIGANSTGQPQRLDNEIQVDSQTSSSVSTASPAPADQPAAYRREFESEELELCRFLRMNNKTDCQVRGDELSSIGFIQTESGHTQRAANDSSRKSSLVEYLRTYYVNKFTLEDDAQKASLGQRELDEAGKAILAQCRPIKRLLDHNLVALKWYRKQALIEDHRLATRSFWCPSLSYWLQVDRLCGELELALAKQADQATFAYEIAPADNNSNNNSSSSSSNNNNIAAST